MEGGDKMEDQQKIITDNEIEVLRHVKNNSEQTKYSISTSLGMRIGSVHLALKNLRRKGYIKIMYQMTPKGEKSIEEHQTVSVKEVVKGKPIDVDRNKYNKVAVVHPREGTVTVVGVDTKNLTVIPYDANLRIYNMYGTV